MMSDLTPQQCISFGNQLSTILSETGDYYDQNFAQLNDTQQAVFRKALKTLSDSSSMLFAYAVLISFNNAQTSIDNLTAATDKMDEIDKTITKVQQWINIAAAAINLGTALIEHNPQSIFRGIGGMVKSIQAAKS
jgi:hypothetical protein